jgi:hypothetical protein
MRNRATNLNLGPKRKRGVRPGQRRGEYHIVKARENHWRDFAFVTLRTFTVADLEQNMMKHCRVPWETVAPQIARGIYPREWDDLHIRFLWKSLAAEHPEGLSPHHLKIRYERACDDELITRAWACLLQASRNVLAKHRNPPLGYAALELRFCIVMLYLVERMVPPFECPVEEAELREWDTRMTSVGRGPAGDLEDIYRRGAAVRVAEIERQLAGLLVKRVNSLEMRFWGAWRRSRAFRAKFFRDVRRLGGEVTAMLRTRGVTDTVEFGVSESWLERNKTRIEAALRHVERDAGGR